MYKILPSITTTLKSDYFQKIKEIEQIGLREFSLFVTGIDYERRKKLYAELEKLTDIKICHVHLRNDMDIKELDYLVKRYNVEVFNIHPSTDEFAFDVEYPKYFDCTYIENTVLFPQSDELKKYGGLCMDFAHWENMILNGEIDFARAKEIDFLVNNCRIGCCHISAISEVPCDNYFVPGSKSYDSHKFKSLNEFDYLKKYKQYFNGIVSMELENTITDQLRVIDYIKSL